MKFFFFCKFRKSYGNYKKIMNFIKSYGNYEMLLQFMKYLFDYSNI